MFVAVDDSGVRCGAEVAERSALYFCPVCGEQVVLRKGPVKVPHFAHRSGTECLDGWHHDMSEWHYGMQSRFPTECREVVVTHDGVKHRADVLFGNTVIEFQHSPISKDEVAARNDFYRAAGYRVLWIFDVREKVKSEMLTEDTEHGEAGLIWRWKRAPAWLDLFIGQSGVAVWLYLCSAEESDENREVTLKIDDWFWCDQLSVYSCCFMTSSYHCPERIGPDMDMDDMFRTTEERRCHYLKQVLYCDSRFWNMRDWSTVDKCPKTDTYADVHVCEQCEWWVGSETRRASVRYRFDGTSVSRSAGHYVYCGYGEPDTSKYIGFRLDT